MDPVQMDAFYFRVTDIWKRMCEEHFTLYNITCDEYVCLLDSDIDKLEEKVAEKSAVITSIGKLEAIRQETIAELNLLLGRQGQIGNVKELLAFMLKHKAEAQGQHLGRFNALLIDLIEKIQDQNKRNQVFINKALKSLKDIREEVTGGKSYQVYTSKGAAQSTPTIRKD